MPNIHESGYIKYLSSNGVDCTVIYQNELEEDRKKLGVVYPDYGLAKMIHCPNESKLPLSIGNNDEIHFFTGIRAFRLTTRAYNKVKKSKALIILISESRRPDNLAGFFRYFSSLILEYYIRKRVDAVLAMGTLGVDWFVKTGYHKKKIYPFSYSVLDYSYDVNKMKESNIINIGFAGSLIHRKNPFLIVKALDKLKLNKIRMNWFGSGQLEKKLKKHTIDKQYENIFWGSLNNNLLREKLIEIDILILPSLWDGWGAIINEGLLAGCRILVSDRCGSSALVNESNGKVFRSNSVDDLSKKIKDLSLLGPLSIGSRCLNISASKNITSKEIGDYILKIIGDLKKNNSRPNELWLNRALDDSIEYEKKKNVIIAYHFLPHYRRGIFNELNLLYNVKFLAENSKSFEGIPIVEMDGAYRFDEINNYRLGKFWFQPKIIYTALFDSYDVVVYLANPYFITTWMAAIISKIRNKKVIFWGHGYHNKENNFVNKLKSCFYSLANALYFYGYNAKKNAIKLGINPDTIYVGFNSLDYKSQIRYREKVLQFESDYSESGLNIICLSRLTVASNYKLLFETLNYLKKEIQFQFNLKIIGDGPCLKDLKEISDSYELNVDFKGAIYDEDLLSKFIYDADVTISPGKVGLTAIHSLMYGTPVITHDQFEMQMPEVEAVVQNVTGLLFEKDNMLSLAEKLINYKNYFPNKRIVRDKCFQMIDQIYNPQKSALIMKMAIEGMHPPLGNDVQSKFRVE